MCVYTYSGYPHTSGASQPDDVSIFKKEIDKEREFERERGRQIGKDGHVSNIEGHIPGNGCVCVSI